jgi:tetraacyldisaccharide 4'-kinase
VAAAQALLAANPQVDILIADDGLQHYALARDIEIVVFDKRGVGNGQLLPAGPLREGLDRLKDPKVKAQVWQGGTGAQPVWAHQSLPSFEMTLVPGVVIRLNAPDKTCALDAFAEHTVYAIAGIGHPERFFQMLRDRGITVIGKVFPDHHRFTEADIAESQYPVLMTEKDAVKCREFAAGHDNWFVVPVTAQIEPSLPLDQWLKLGSLRR